MTKWDHLHEAERLLADAKALYRKANDTGAVVTELAVEYANSLTRIAEVHVQIFKEMRG